jgi:hypothetical protein
LAVLGRNWKCFFGIREIAIQVLNSIYFGVHSTSSRLAAQNTNKKKCFINKYYFNQIIIFFHIFLFLVDMRNRKLSFSHFLIFGR